MANNSRTKSQDYNFQFVDGKWHSLNTRMEIEHIFAYLGLKVPDLQFTTFARLRQGNCELEFRHYWIDKITLTITYYYE